jgi:hypothetical protein
MNPVPPQVWKRLDEARPTGEALTARLALPEITHRLQAALDSEGNRHLIIRLTPTENDLRDVESRGLTIVTRELIIVGQSATRFLDLKCRDANGHAAFDLIGGEIAEALAAAGRSPGEIVSRVLAKWRRFWGQLPRQMLSYEEQVGLFAELWFLAVWLIPRCGTTEAIRRWRGPYGSRHDFEWTGKSVEVKATTSTQGRVHRINGIHQLEPPEEGKLFLFSLRLRREEGATNTLNILVERCRALLATDADALDRWEAALVRAGYSPAHQEEYDKTHLRVVDEFLYAVHDDFPRLTPDSLRAGVPMGVDGVAYDIHIDGFLHLIITAHESLDLILGAD